MQVWQVLASNVPSGSGWQYTVFGNSLVVACAQLTFSELVASPLATLLAQTHFGFNDSAKLTSDYVVLVHRSQVSSCAYPSLPPNSRLNRLP